MKKSNFLLLFVIWISLVSGFNAYSQSTGVIDQVKDAFKAGSAKELAKYLHQTVDLTFDGKLENFSKTQAEFVLRDFFKAHAPNEFTIIHQGSSKGGQPFAIGKYISGNETYRVWMKIKMVNNQQVIQEISFVKE